MSKEDNHKGADSGPIYPPVTPDMKPDNIDKELDFIQSMIWAKINDVLERRGVKISIGDAYDAGSSIKEELHPRVKALIHSSNKRTEIEAAKAYDKVAYKLWGDRAKLNFPKEGKKNDRN